MTKRNVVKNLRLSEISGVTVPAQTHALVSVMKSAESVELVKYLSTDEGAKTFNDFMTDELRQRRKSKIYEELWPQFDALRNSIASIKLDDSLTEDGRSARISEAVSQFGSVVKSKDCQHPASHVNSVLFDALTKFQEESNHMSEELVKKADELTAQVAELTKKLAESEVVAKMTDDEKKYLADLDKEGADAFRAASAADRAKMMKKSAESDEVFKSADGHEIRKSAVGDGVFAILKAQDEAIRSAREEMVKAADHARTIEFTKRADEEFANLPGETVAKVAVLKGMHSMDDAARETLFTMLKAGNEAIAKGFQTFGVSHGKPGDITKASRLASEIKKAREADPTLTEATAMNKVLSANPELYEG